MSYTDTLHYTNYGKVIPQVHNLWQQKVPVLTYLCVSIQKQYYFVIIQINPTLTVLLCFVSDEGLSNYIPFTIFTLLMCLFVINKLLIGLNQKQVTWPLFTGVVITNLCWHWHTDTVGNFTCRSVFTLLN